MVWTHAAELVEDKADQATTMNPDAPSGSKIEILWAFWIDPHKAVSLTRRGC